MRARRGCQATLPQTSFRNRPLIPPAACPRLTAPRSPTKHWLGVRPRAVLVPPTLVIDPCDGEWEDLVSLPFGASESCDELSLFCKRICSILLPPCSYRCCSRVCFPANQGANLCLLSGPLDTQPVLCFISRMHKHVVSSLKHSDDFNFPLFQRC